MGVMCLIYLVASLRTNVCFVFIFFTLVMCFGMLTAAYWYLAEDYVGNAALATRYIVVSDYHACFYWGRPTMYILRKCQWICRCLLTMMWLLGWRRLRICHMRVRLVDLLRDHLGICGLSHLAAGGRSLYIRQGEVDTLGCSGKETSVAVVDGPLGSKVFSECLQRKSCPMGGL